MQSSKVVVVLAKGRELASDYADLIERTLSVARQRWAKECDHVIFHEGNIPPAHQHFIQSELPLLRLRFVSIRQTFELRKARAAQIMQLGGTTRSREHGCDPVLAQGPGYKAMCDFWYAGFLRYTQTYTHMLRIDEDCVLEDDQPDPFEFALSASADIAATSWWTRDSETVTMGMSMLFRSLATNLSTRGAEPLTFPEPGRWKSPYSNVMLVRLRWAHAMQWALDAVTASECILSNRWGDMPLWGATLRLSKRMAHAGHAVSLPLSYLHKSHSTLVRPLFRSGETVLLSGNDVTNTNLSSTSAPRVGTKLVGGDRMRQEQRVALKGVQGYDNELIDLSVSSEPLANGSFYNAIVQVDVAKAKGRFSLAATLSCGRGVGVCKWVLHTLDGYSLLLGLGLGVAIACGTATLAFCTWRRARRRTREATYSTMTTDLLPYVPSTERTMDALKIDA